MATHDRDDTRRADGQNGRHNGQAGQEDSTHRQLVALLLEKIDADPYPSGTMMDLLEEIALPDERAALAAVLMDKIRRDAFPSLDMMCRARDLS